MSGTVDRKVVEAARSFGLRGTRLVRQVVIPLAMPSKGIDYLVLQASSFNNIADLVVCVVLYALLEIVADLLVRLVERLSMPWRRQLAVR